VVDSKVVLNQRQIHQPCQKNQRVLYGELLIQARAEQLGGLDVASVGLHGWQNSQESARLVNVSIKKSHHTSAYIFSSLTVCK
jgi:hypothetical protein